MQETKYTLLRDKYLEELSHLADETKKGYRTAINNLGKFINYKDVFDKRDIIDYLNSEGFQSLEVSSQNSYKAKLKSFLFWIGFQKKDILSILGKKNVIKSCSKLNLSILSFSISLLIFPQPYFIFKST
ncbi:MAG: hypothetical protein HWN80_17890 [Candidatus Lokiarchaeota archaeon]|nr:hypothetical protein [Candidatus Lokiarchaeota archaeon]